MQSTDPRVTAQPTNPERLREFVSRLDPETIELFERYPQHFTLCGCETGEWGKLEGCSVCEDCGYTPGVNICGQSIHEADQGVDSSRRILLVCNCCSAQPDIGPECPHCTGWLTALEIDPAGVVEKSRIATRADVRSHPRVAAKREGDGS